MYIYATTPGRTVNGNDHESAALCIVGNIPDVSCLTFISLDTYGYQSPEMWLMTLKTIFWHFIALSESPHSASICCFEQHVQSFLFVL